MVNDRISYYSVAEFEDEKQYYSDKFRSELKRSLVKKISEFVSTSSKITVKNKTKNRESQANFNAVSLVVDPKFSKCGNIAVISVRKDTYQKAQYDDFRRKLEFHSRNLNNFVQSMDAETVTKKLLKEKVKYYTSELNNVSSLIPLINLKSSDKDLLDKYSKNLSLLENLLDQLKQSKKINWKKLKDGVVDGINDLIG
tara:strand:- start:227 stop:820 length:594 start_codon:yes stop_codon:yes gene_type:complete